MEVLKYDLRTYRRIVDSGRLRGLDVGSLARLTNPDSGNKEFEIGDSMRFLKDSFFSAEDVGNILRIFFPLDGTCYWRSDLKSRKIDFRFYNIPIRGD